MCLTNQSVIGVVIEATRGTVRNMRLIWLTICLLTLGASAFAEGQGEVQYVVIADPYIDLRTGAGSGYPVTQVAERGDEIAILKRRTQWFKVLTRRGYEGWVFEDQLQRTLQPLSGELVSVTTSSFRDYAQRRWEAGVSLGDFDGSTTVTAFGSYRLSHHLALEAEFGELYASNADGWLGTVAISHTFAPEWRASPFFLLGTGIIDIEPKGGLVEEDDQNDQVALVGAGFKVFMTRRLLFKAEYKSYVILDSDDENEDVDEWKAGFAVFF